MISIQNRSKYRKEATNGYEYGDLDGSEFKCEEVIISTQTITEVINDIESDVNEMVSLLDDVKGLAEIEVVKEKLSALLEKLY